MQVVLGRLDGKKLEDKDKNVMSEFLQGVRYYQSEKCPAKTPMVCPF